MILVDTSVWVDYFRGKDTDKTFLLEKYLNRDIIVIGDLIIAELFQGFRNEIDASKAFVELENLFYFDMIGKDIAYKSANNYRYLRKKGVTVRKTIDVLIGTFCIHNKIKLLHDDRDFDSLERFLNLMVVKN